jgi:CRISPR system Cascade subunit CasE
LLEGDGYIHLHPFILRASGDHLINHILSMHKTRLYLDSSHLPIIREDHSLSVAASTSYLVKCLLGEIFREKKPIRWRMDAPDGQWIPVLAYTPVSANELQEYAQIASPPELYQACRWERCASKPVPTYPEGTYKYLARVCPAVQKSSGGSCETSNGDVAEWNSGDEIDVFLSEISKGSTPPSREHAYAKWLHDQFAMDAHDWGATIDSAQTTSWSIEKTTVTSGGVRHLERPDARIAGILEVTDPNAFRSFLAQGVGKLKAFGYGLVDVLEPVE